MNIVRSRRLIVLFVVAVLLPCAVLIVMGFRSMRQDRELAVERRAGEQARNARDMRQLLLARLEELKARHASPSAANPSAGTANATSVRLVGEVRARGLVLPWETNRLHPGNGASAASVQLRQAQREEFANNDPGKAAAMLEQFARTTTRGELIGLARLARARALEKTGRNTESSNEYGQVLALPWHVHDALGVPLALYAATRLAAKSDSAVFLRIRGGLSESCCITPESLYMFRAVVDTLRTRGVFESEARELSERLTRAISSAEQAQALQADIAALGLGLPRFGGGMSPRWALYGADPWFVSLASSSGPAAGAAFAGKVVALDASSVLEEVNRRASDSLGISARLRLPGFQGREGRLLAADLSDIPVRHLAGEQAGAGEGFVSFFPMAVLLLVGVTLFAAYLIWFDVGRELRVAELRSQFVASVSHELKTPLTAIRMYAETILLDRSPDPEQRREYLTTIVSEAERLTRLLNNVLDLGKIERGEQRYRFAPVHLETMVERCARTLEHPLSQQGFNLRLEVDRSLPPVPGDEDALQQAVMNLLTNAMKYSGESRDITLALRRHGGLAVIEVTDGGPGIPAEYVSRVVEKFYRVPTAENARIPGTGLGLTLVDHITSAHRGSLAIASQPGLGTTVGIRLPLNGAS